MNKNIWEVNYRKGRYNKYPYELIISTIAKYYYKYENRNEIKILDLGCGGGNNTFFLAEQGFCTYGIDGSPTAIKITKKRLKEKKLSAFLIVGNFEKLPFSNCFFDCVIDRQSISFGNLFNEIEIIIKEIYRVLKYNGRYIGLLMNEENPNRKYGEKIEKSTYNNFKKGNLANSGLTHFFNKNEINLLFSKFKIEHLLNHKLINVLPNKNNELMEMSEYFLIVKKVKDRKI